MQLLLVDNRVEDVQTVTQSLLPSVDCVSVDFENDTYDTLIAKIPVKTYDSVGIFQENYELNDYQFIHSFPNSVLTNVESQDPNLDTWSQYKQLLSYFKDTLQIQTLDLMGCNIYSSPDWNYVIDYLGKQFQININSSNDNTGSTDFGGNWILESGNVNLVGKYFSNNIEKYQFILGTTSFISYVITTDNKLYGCGNYINTMKDGDTVGVYDFVEITTNIDKLNNGRLNTSSLIIKQDGSVWATGTNTNGQLGTGNTTNLLAFTKVYTPSSLNKTCIAVVTGTSHSLILLTDGSVLAAGLNSNGQLGTGNTTQQTSFTQVYTPPALNKTCTAISCGANHSLILLSDGSVLATGLNSNGQLGTGNTTQQTSFTKVYTPALNKTCISISGGTNHSLILLSDGSVLAAGYNSNGQLGTGNTTQQILFTQVYTPALNKTCTAISSGNGYSVILLSDGSVMATGLNGNGQLGTNNTTQQTSFTQVYNPVNNSNIKCTAISAGINHTLILLSDGSVCGTGYNNNGQLGYGGNAQKTSFLRVYNPGNNSNIKCKAITTGNNYSLILLSNGSLQASGLNTNSQLGLPKAPYLTLTFLDIYATSISVGLDYVILTKTDGSVWGKGLNSSGQLGTGNNTNLSAFTKVYTPSLNKTCIGVSVSSYHSLILLSDGSVWSTGLNSYGQLGTGNTVQKKLFIQVYTPTLNKTCIAISCGLYHSLILLSDGSVLATGSNLYGQLGTGNTADCLDFTKVYTPDLNKTCIAIYVGAIHSLILLSDGSVWATGLNTNGQLGTGNTTQQTSFTQVYTPTLNKTCIAVSCGYYHTQILLSDGSVWATGLNTNGQLGTGNTTQQTSFTQVYTPALNKTCIAISCGSYHSLILLSDGSVLATGLNSNGQLGTGNTTQRTSFTFMLNTDLTNMSNVLRLFENPPSLPAAPTISSVNGSSLTRVNPTITISVANTSDASITNYSWSIDGINYTVLSPPQNTSTLTIPATELTSESNYTFQIKAINAVGTSGASDGVSATFTIPPNAPIITNITSTQGVTSISFQNPSDASITNYAYSTSSLTDIYDFTPNPFTSYTPLSPEQTSSPLIISGLHGVFQIKIKAFNGSYSDESAPFKNWYEPPFV